MTDKPVHVEFELKKDGVEKLRYSETYPRGMVGSFYLSRIASHLIWGGNPPKRIRITIEALPE